MPARTNATHPYSPSGEYFFRFCLHSSAFAGNASASKHVCMQCIHVQVSIFLFLFTLIHVCRQHISKQTRPHATQHATHLHPGKYCFSFAFTLIRICRQRISKQTCPHATQHAMHLHSQCPHPPSPSHPTGFFFFFLFLPLICVTPTRNTSAHHVHASAYHVHHPISPILVSSFFVVSFVCTNLHPPPSPQ